MIIYILTLFPEAFSNPFSHSIIARAINKKLVQIKTLNIRDFASDAHKSVDDKPYGGGPGMILRVDVVVKALNSIKPKPYSILLSASGKKYTQKSANILSKKKSIALICGRYEGVDARVEKFVNETYSLGDYVLSGGEIAAMAVIDSTVRLIPGVLSKDSITSESFSKSSNLEYPQFTRPETFQGLRVPETLLSGNHKKIDSWRKKEAKIRTIKMRPDIKSKN